MLSYPNFSMAALSFRVTRGMGKLYHTETVEPVSARRGTFAGTFAAASRRRNAEHRGPHAPRPAAASQRA